ncbi:MAG: thiol:disulfide interchange protein DsbG [Candidatus Competibacteraceae bacterium]|nr:thiol:disulfide interchange protein DsbG [Candidatus Competibacteraceae bacterium]
MNKFLFALVALLALGTVQAQQTAPAAPEATAETTGQYPQAIQNLLRPGVTVTRTFPGPMGTTGYLLSLQGQHDILYLGPDEEHIFVGQIIDAQGNNLTARHMEQYVPAPDYSAAWEQMEQSHYVAEGDDDPESVVYVFADPYCPFCHAFWKASLPYQAAGLQVRWLLVSYLRPDGEAKAAAIMEADDPEAALKAHEEAFRSGGIDPLENPDPETLAAIRANGQLMSQLGISGTPAVFYQDQQGEVKAVVGMPRLSSLPQIFALPEQEILDPGLERFR